MVEGGDDGLWLLAEWPPWPSQLHVPVSQWVWRAGRGCPRWQFWDCDEAIPKTGDTGGPLQTADAQDVSQGWEAEAAPYAHVS